MENRMNLLERIFRPDSSFGSKQRTVIMLACSIVLIVTLFSFFGYTLFSFNQESRNRLNALGDIVGADVGCSTVLWRRTGDCQVT